MSAVAQALVFFILIQSELCRTEGLAQRNGAPSTAEAKTSSDEEGVALGHDTAKKVRRFDISASPRLLELAKCLDFHYVPRSSLESTQSAL